MESQKSRTLSFSGRKYLDLVEGQHHNNITVECKLCPGEKHLSTARNTTSNLLKNLQKQHAKTKLVSKDTGGLTTAAVGLPQPNNQGWSPGGYLYRPTYCNLDIIYNE